MYTDGFVIPIPTAKLDQYLKMAQAGADIWMEYGALDYKECVLEDASSEHCASFPQGLGLADDHTVVFSWITYKSRQHRDEVNAKVMADPRIHESCSQGDMPFDPKKMLYSGFEVIVDALKKPANNAS